jgi:hypothetical protein
MTGDLEIGKTEMHDDGTNLIVTIELKNDSDRTLHAYADPRNIQYDPATKKLTIYLTDRATKETMASIFRRPRLRAVDPKATTVLTLKLPRQLTRFAKSEEKLVSPQFEKLPIYEAESVEVNVAWSDKPFYADPRPKQVKRTAREELIAWEKGVSVGTGAKRP